MRKKIMVAAIVFLGLAWAGPGFGASYVQQASFPMPLSIGWIDSDAASNLYILGQKPGSTAYSIASFQTQNIEPLLSFDMGASKPIAFSVEATGNLNVLNLDMTTGVFSLLRYSNVGSFLGQVTIPYTITKDYAYSAAIDKINKLVYITKFWRIRPCLDLIGGCSGPPPGTPGVVYQYNFQGSLLRTITLSGDAYSGTGCYQPKSLTMDWQGNLVIADPVCHHLLKYGSNGTLLNDVAIADLSPGRIWTDNASNLFSSQFICSGSSCLSGIVKYGSDGTRLTDFTTGNTTGLPVGVAWDGRIVYLSPATGSTSLQRFILNSPPSVAVQTAPIGSVLQHSNQASLNWQPAGDLDNDSIAYSVYLGPSISDMPLVANTGNTSFQTAGLSFGTPYYWQIVAQDFYLGLPLQTTPAPIAGFNLSLLNSAPGAFSPIGGAGVALTRSTSVQLAWQSSIDPDGDPVAYDVYWRPAAQPSPILLGSTPDTSWTMSELSFATTYYWSVTARDSFGAARPMAGGEQSYLPIFKNSPPGSFSIVSGTGTAATRNRSVDLLWGPAIDPDGDPVTYDFYWRASSQPAASLLHSGPETSWSMTGLEFQTTYYWSVSAHDPYGGITPIARGEQPYLPIFKNSPPSPVIYQSTAAAYWQHTSSPSIPLSWAASADPDQDPVAYRLEVKTSSGAWPSLDFTSAGGIALDALFETTYYWRVSASDAYGGVSTGPWVSAIVHLANRPPYPIVALSSASIASRATTFNLEWKDAGDPDGDPVSYSLFLSTDPAAQDLVQKGAESSYVLNFQFGTAYYWRVSAADGFGSRTEGPLNKFFPTFQNSPPAPPKVASGAGLMKQHARTPTATLSWTPAVDADGDTVAYRLYWGSSPASLGLTMENDSTSYSVPGLSFETTYYWQVEAYDAYSVSTTPIQSLVVSLQNSAPQPFGVAAGAGQIVTRSSSQEFSWQPSVDPDGDRVEYRFSIGLDSSSVARGLNAVVLSTTSYVLDSLSYGSTYYWNVVAVDPFGVRTPLSGGLQRFLPIFKNELPQPVGGATVSLPSGEVKSSKNSLRLVWPIFVDPNGDRISYTLFLDGVPVYKGAANSFTLADLNFQRAYAYRIEAINEHGAIAEAGSGLFTLAVESAQPEPYSYPNPFRLGQGTNFVYTTLAPVEGVKISVYSVYQNLVWRQETGPLSAGVHEIHWDGRDLNGRRVYSGFYIAMIESPQGRQTIKLVGVR